MPDLAKIEVLEIIYIIMTACHGSAKESTDSKVNHDRLP